MISAGEILSIFQHFELSLSRNQAEQILAYMALLLKWNKTINLTAVTEPREIISRHFAESILATKIVDLSHGRLADIGPGAGFPALALSIFSPELNVTLVESNARKCAFLKEVARSLGLDRVTVLHRRLQFSDPVGELFDFITARALGDYDSFLPWARSSLSSNGYLILWLGISEAERLARDETFAWQPLYPVQGTSGRVILAGRRFR